MKQLLTPILPKDNEVIISLEEKSYTRENIKTAIQLAREATSIDGTVDLDVVLSFPFADNSDLRTKWTVEEIFEQIDN